MALIFIISDGEDTTQLQLLTKRCRGPDAMMRTIGMVSGGAMILFGVFRRKRS